MARRIWKDNAKCRVIDMTDSITAFIDFCQSKNLSPNTLIFYTHRLRSFGRYLSANEPEAGPADITPQIIRAFLAQEIKDKSAATAKHSHTTLRAFFRFLLAEGLIKSNPMENVDKVKTVKRLIETFSQEQVEAIVAACSKDFVGVRDKAIVMTLFDCGLRASELCDLTLDDVTWNSQTLKVLGKGGRERLVPFGQSTRVVLRNYVSRRGELPTDRLFVNCYGEPLTRFSLQELVRRRCEKANISGIRCSPHTFRHSFAVSFLRNGGDAFTLQKILGHSDLSMTRRYVELSQTDVQQKHRLYSPADRLSMPAPKEGRTRLK